MRCGAYASTRPINLLEPCRGAPDQTDFGHNALKRIRAGKHPADTKVQLGIAAPGMRIAAHWGCAPHSLPFDGVVQHGSGQDVNPRAADVRQNLQAGIQQSNQVVPSSRQSDALEELMDLQRCGLKVVIP